MFLFMSTPGLIAEDRDPFTVRESTFRDDGKLIRLFYIGLGISYIYAVNRHELTKQPH